jgi:hypothetical protein
VVCIAHGGGLKRIQQRTLSARQVTNSYDIVGKTFEDIAMPTISMFYGILIRMFFKDIERHKLAHIHAEYQGSVGKKPFPIKGLDQ